MGSRSLAACALEAGWRPVALGSPAFAAVWTSRLFHFKDDLSVNLLPEKGGTKVRVKSASRVGRYDFGQNARHVRQFFEELERELQTSSSDPLSVVSSELKTEN
jgi:hypothetical protein